MTDQQIAVSVAVITYNMQRYLPQLLDSILMQKVSFRYEIIVDDDHSPDDSRQILQITETAPSCIHPQISLQFILFMIY